MVSGTLDLRKDDDYDGVYYLGTQELWTTSRCAIQLNYKSKYAAAVVDKVMRRKGLRPVLRLSGRDGAENLWEADEVIALPPNQKSE